jgi:chemotaxis protein histidine kinase CheA
MLNDSGIEIDDEFLQTFLDESQEVLTEMKQFMQEFHEPRDNHLFEQYGQKVDRIMGAAYTLSLNEVGDLARYGKEIGYKSSQITDTAKLLVIHSLLSQLLKTLETIVKGFRKGNRPDAEEHAALIVRLEAANKSLGDLRASVKI